MITLASKAAPDVDLTACDREPIHIPGAIQPHGALLVLDPADFTILQASANAGALLGVTELLGRTLPEALAELPSGFRDDLRSWANGEAVVFLKEVGLAGRPLFAAAHRSGGAVLLEFEETPVGAPLAAEAPFARLKVYAEELQAAQTYEKLCQLVADEVRVLTGFDRVLVYRFDPDWHGHVVAESNNGVLPAYLHLRFPATDIPKQARELYRLNRLRIIPSVEYAPVPIEPALNPRTGAPLDLSLAGLRSVSPVHVEYMRNMGTAASMSVSILVDGELWGLVACHNQDPKVVPLPARETCEFATQMFAMQIASRSHAEDAAQGVALNAIHTRLLSQMALAGSFQAGLVDSPDDLLALTDAAGAAIIIGAEIHVVGQTPPGERLREIVAWLDANGRPEVCSTDCLPDLVPGQIGCADTAAGLLAISLSELHSAYLMWFRPEVLRTVAWSGDPRKAVQDDGKIHPRTSFEIWKERVSLRSTPWTAPQLSAARELRVAIVGIVMRTAEELAQLNHELRRSNKELEAFSYSVSHDLRAPFRHIVGYSELLREQGDLEGRSRHYVDSIAEAAISAGRLVDDLLNFSHLGRTSLQMTRVDMNKLAEEARRSALVEVADREIVWNIEPLPDAWGDPAMLRQVMINVVGNAVKYTRTRQRAEITITGEANEADTLYCIADNGVGFDMKYVGKIFGVFQRLQRAEDFEGTGIGLALVRRIIDRHKGHVWAEGELDRGARFFITLPRQAKGPSRG